MNCIRKILSMITLCMALGGCNGTIGISSTLASAEGQTVKSDYANECSIIIDDDISINGNGAWLDSGRISITEGGVYKLTGRAEKGISIDTPEPVKLVLAGAAVSAAEGSGVLNGRGKLTIFAAEGTDNSITGGSKEENEGFGVYSKGGLTLCGGGRLTVKSERGVFSEEEIEIGDIYLDVTASQKGISGKAILINSGETLVNTDKSGLCAKENILIRGGRAAAFGAAAEKIAAEGGELLILGEISGETEGFRRFSKEVKAGAFASVLKNGKSVLELTAPADCQGILFGCGADSDGYSVALDGKVLD